MNPPPPEAPTPSTLGAVDLDPWIPKPSTRDIVDHLMQEINAAKQIAEEITSVQGVLDGMMEEGKLQGCFDGGIVEKVTKELEEKCRRVEELERVLGVEREEKRVLEERIRCMEDGFRRKLEAVTSEGEIAEKEVSVEKEDVEVSTETTAEPTTLLAIPAGTEQSSTTETGIATPPTSPPSTAPSSPLQDSSTRSISPISLPSTESSHNIESTTHLLEKISQLESQLATATKQIEDLQQLQQGPISAAITSSIDFPFTFVAPSSPSRTPSKRNRGSVRRRKTTENKSEIMGVEFAEAPAKDKGDNRELIEGLCAAVGVVVLGWMGMWLVNHLIERGERVVK